MKSSPKLPFKSINYELRKYGPSTVGRIIILEGLISAGKSTAGRQITSFLQNLGIKAKFFPEPLIPGLLKLFLSDQKKYAFAFQLAMLVKRQAIYREAYELTKQGYCCIIDRSLYGDYCFALMHKNRGNISGQTKLDDTAPTEWDSYLASLHAEEFEHPDYVVYLKVTPETAIERCKNRDRDGEKAYDMDYFSQLCSVYDGVIPSSPSQNILVIDWNKDRNNQDGDIPRDILDHVKKAYDNV